MAVNPMQWFFTNRYVHIRSFLQPALEDELVPHHLRERVEGRITNAIRLAKIRIGLHAIIYISIVGTVVSTVLNWIAQHFGSALFTFFGTVFASLVWLVTFLVLTAVIGLLLVNRALSLLEADIYVLSMEVVARTVVEKSDTMPSYQRIQRKYVKT